MFKPIGVILAGGQATRMGGGDKGALLLGGISMLDRVIDRLGPQTDRLVLNANGDPARFAEYGLPVVADSLPGFPGPLAGVLAGMDWAAAQGASHIVTAAADTPFFPADMVARLIRAAERAATPIALAATQEGGRTNRHPPLACGRSPCGPICARRWRAGCARSCCGPTSMGLPPLPLMTVRFSM